MTAGYRNASGVDADDLFDPDVVGDGYTATFLRRADGTPLRYASAVYGTPGAAFGYRDNTGADVGPKWAKKGTANYWSVVNMNAPGYEHSTTSGNAVLGNSEFRIVFHANGTLTQEVAGDNSTGLAWSVVNTSTFARGGNPASSYQVRLSWAITTNNYTGTGTAASYIQQTNGAGAFTSVTGDIALDIRNGTGYIFNGNYPVPHGSVVITVTVELRDPSGQVTTKSYTCVMDMWGDPQPAG